MTEKGDNNYVNSLAFRGAGQCFWLVFKDSAKLALATQAVNSSAEFACAAKPVTFEIVHFCISLLALF